MKLGLYRVKEGGVLHNFELHNNPCYEKGTLLLVFNVTWLSGELTEQLYTIHIVNPSGVVVRYRTYTKTTFTSCVKLVREQKEL